MVPSTGNHTGIEAASQTWVQILLQPLLPAWSWASHNSSSPQLPHPPKADSMLTSWGYWESKWSNAREWPGTQPALSEMVSINRLSLCALPMSPSQHRDDHLLYLLCPGHDAPPPVHLQQGDLRWGPEGEGTLRRHCAVTGPDSHSLHHRDLPQCQTATIRTLCHQGKNLGVWAGRKKTAFISVCGLRQVIWAFLCWFFFLVNNKKSLLLGYLLHGIVMYLRILLKSQEKKK